MSASGSHRRIRVRASGRVQGVFFRAATSERAGQLGLVGWVRNCADGSVELEAEGPAERLDQLAGWCQVGPPAARVAEVSVDWIDPTGVERRFAVVR